MENYEMKMTTTRSDSPAPVEQTVTALLKDTSMAAGEFWLCVRRIQDHLFGAEKVEGEGCGKECAPRSFKEELQRTNYTVHGIMNELYKICALLGVE